VEVLMKGKYSRMSTTDIELKVSQGIFKEDEANRVIRDDKNRIVRFLTKPESDNQYFSNQNFYNQYVQVVNNYVTYTDTKKIIEEILNIKNQEVFLELKKSHKTCMNFLEQYQSSKNERIIKKLNESALEAISEYQTFLESYLETGIEDIDKERLLISCGGYLDLIKIYKLSSYRYHNSNTYDFFQVKNFIDCIFSPLRKIFEELVCKHNEYDKEKGVHYYDVDNSLYLTLFLERKHDVLEKYSVMDSRFSSFSRVTSLIACVFNDDKPVRFEKPKKDIKKEEFVEELYLLLLKFEELNAYNNLFNHEHNDIYLEDKRISDFLLPIRT